MKVDMVSVGISFHTDSAVTQGITYYYVVRAQDAAGNTDSNTNEVWTTAGLSITSFDPIVGQITVYGATVADELSDPQELEVFLNGSSQGTVTADANYQFIKSNIALASGTNRVEVQSTDRAGNKSELSKSLKLDYNPEGLTVFRSVHVVKSGSSIAGDR